jgi:hypothetical protein
VEGFEFETIGFLTPALSSLGEEREKIGCPYQDALFPNGQRIFFSAYPMEYAKLPSDE